jgi:hypothetical protein
MNPFVRIVVYEFSGRRDRNTTIKIFTKRKAMTNKLQRALRDAAGRTLRHDATLLHCARGTVPADQATMCADH